MFTSFISKFVFSFGNGQTDRHTHTQTAGKSYRLRCASPPKNIFKVRLGTHKNSFKNPTVNQTSLSRHIWDLKKQKKTYTISWDLIDKGKTFSPISGVCVLCTKEKFHIIFNPEGADLNSNDEIYSNCRHKKPKLLIPQAEKT